MDDKKQLEAYRKHPSALCSVFCLLRRIDSPDLLNEPTFEPRLLTPTTGQKERRRRSSTGNKRSPGPAPKLGGIKREKFNSTATIFLNTMIRAPDTREIVKWSINYY